MTRKSKRIKVNFSDLFSVSTKPTYLPMHSIPETLLLLDIIGGTTTETALVSATLPFPGSDHRDCAESSSGYRG
jgi:hypothetical protein